MRRGFLDVVLTLSLIGIMLPSFAFVQLEQTRFNKQVQIKGGMQFEYHWQLDDTAHTLRFDLNQQQLSSLPLTAPKFSNQMLNREVEVALKRHAINLAERGIQARVRKRPREISYSVSAPSQKVAELALKELEDVSKSARQAYYDKHYIVNFSDHLQRNFVQNDYVQYARQSVGGLTPIAEAIKAMQQNANDPREFALLAITWLQSIPYNDLLNRSDSNGAGFLAPIDLLRRNIGDCDSKSTLLAALLKAYDTRLKVYMVLLPEHALLAVELSAKDSEQTLSIDGADMLLLEPTGPAHFTLGEIDDKSAIAILNKQYKTLLL